LKVDICQLSRVGLPPKRPSEKLLSKDEMLHAMITNGSAIGVVCVTGEAIRPIVPVVSKGRVPVASRYGAVFAPQGVPGFALAFR
jgi:hypothetical protein